MLSVQVIAKAGITHRNGFSAKPPTVLLQFNKDFELGGDGVSDKKHPDSLSAGSPSRAGGLVSPSTPVALNPMHSSHVAPNFTCDTYIAFNSRSKMVVAWHIP